jgi:hypothetical protein
LSDPIYREPVEKIAQGDIVILPHLHIKEIQGIADDDGFVSIAAQGRLAPSLILNFDCEIEKPWSQRFVICPIVPLAELKDSQRTNAKNNRIAHLFSMPRYKDILVDSVAVLNQQTTIDRSLVNPSKRLATLTVVGRLALYGQWIRWLTRWELATITCPGCQTEIEPAAILGVRDPSDP